MYKTLLDFIESDEVLKRKHDKKVKGFDVDFNMLDLQKVWNYRGDVIRHLDEDLKKTGDESSIYYRELAEAKVEIASLKAMLVEARTDHTPMRRM